MCPHRAGRSKARARLKLSIYGADDDTIEGVVACRLAERGLKVATVEAGTGGQLAGRLAGAPREACREVFLGGRVVPELGGPAEDAAKALRAESGATLALATCAGSSGDRKLYLEVALATPEGVKTTSRGFSGSPKLGAEWAANAVLGLVWRYLQEDAPDRGG